MQPPDPPAPGILEAHDVEICYGQIRAVRRVSLSVRAGEIVALLGSNGAGKTTFLRGMSGLERVRSGRVMFCGQDVTNRPTHQLVQLGLSHVPEGRRLFGTLTVEENLRIGGHLDRHRAEVLVHRRDHVYHLFPRLHERRHQLAGTLSGGEQQMVALGRALMSEPKLLALDEPSLGLSPMATRLILNRVKDIAEAGTAVLLVEQNARQALRFSTRAYIIESGEIALSGSSAALLSNKQVEALYLGGEPLPPPDAAALQSP